MFNYCNTHVFEHATRSKNKPKRHHNCVPNGRIYGPGRIETPFFTMLTHMRNAVSKEAPQFKLGGARWGPACETTPVFPEGRAKNEQMAGEG